MLRNGEPVVELGDDELRDTYSVTKSVVSTLAGIALRRGDVTTIEPWRPLLTMTACLQSEIDDMIALDSGWGETLTSFPRAAPGSFRYDNGTAHILACELARALGTSLDEYPAETPGGPPEHRPYGFFWWIGGGYFGAGYLGQLLWVGGDAVVASNAGEAFVP